MTCVCSKGSIDSFQLTVAPEVVSTVTGILMYLVGMIHDVCFICFIII